MSNLALPSPKSQPGPSSYGGFILPSSSSSAASPSVSPKNKDYDDKDNSDSDAQDLPLPFPEALSRRDFLAPQFDPATYLSNLHTNQNRHQTLEDLRTELRDRSAAISAELLELINANYTSFLNLGDELSGGEDRVEDVRVALLGFRRQVEDIQARVRERRVEVGKLNGELGDVREAIELGRSMLELDERVGNLEGRLALGSLGKKSGGDEEDDDDEDDGWDEDEFDSQDSSSEGEQDGTEVGFVGSSPGKLAALAREYVKVERLADSIGRDDVPFVRKMEERITRCRNTLLLDLNTGLKGARKSAKSSTTNQGRVIKFLAIYRLLDAQGEAVRILKEK